MAALESLLFISVAVCIYSHPPRVGNTDWRKLSIKDFAVSSHVFGEYGDGALEDEAAGADRFECGVRSAECGGTLYGARSR